MQPGLEYYSTSYSAGPGIASPPKVFGAADVAKLTNDRIDQAVQDEIKQRQLKSQQLQKMLGELKVNPTGMRSQDLPDFVNAKKKLEDFYTQSLMKGVDPNNPRFLQEYNKALNARNALQASVVASGNANKVTIAAAKDLDASLKIPNSQVDYDASMRNIQDYNNAPLEQVMKWNKPLIVQSQFDADKWKQKFITGTQGVLGKPDVDQTIIGDKKQPLDEKRLTELTGAKQSRQLTDDEKQELGKLQATADYNSKVIPGTTHTDKEANYGKPVSFDIPTEQGGTAPFAVIPSRILGAARFALQNQDMQKYYTKGMNNLMNGKNDLTGQVPMKKDDNGNLVPDNDISDLYRKKYKNIVDASAAYSQNGQPMDGVELYAAMDIQEEAGHTDAIAAGLKATEAEKARYKQYSSKYGMELGIQRSLADHFASTVKKLYSGKIGTDGYTQFPDGTYHAVSLIADNKVIGNDYVDAAGKKHPNTIVDAQWMNNPETGQPSLAVQTVSSVKKIPDNLKGDYDKKVVEMDGLKSGYAPSKDGSPDLTRPNYDFKNKIWLNEAAHTEFNTKAADLKNILKQGGAGWEFPNARDFGYDYFKGNAPSKDVTTLQSLYDDAAKAQGVYTIGKQPPVTTPTKKQIKQADIAVQSKKLGYTVDEYTKLLKDKGIEIVK